MYGGRISLPAPLENRSNMLATKLEIPLTEFCLVLDRVNYSLTVEIRLE